MKANKPHKALLKRVKITKSGKVKHKSANSKHLKSSKSPNRLRRLRKDKFVSTADAKNIERMLYRRIRGRTQPRTAIKRSPSPEERKAAQAEALKAAAGTAAKA